MATTDRPTAEAQLSFLNTAVKKGVDTAVSAHGEILSAGEAAALKKLTPDELKNLHDIQAKIVASRAAGRAAADWTCVNVVC